MLRSIALLLRHAAAEPELATSLEDAVGQALAKTPTPDAGGRATTAEFSEFVLKQMERVLAAS
jgi:isocitrate/isopropylmalate dehydrogenase